MDKIFFVVFGILIGNSTLGQTIPQVLSSSSWKVNVNLCELKEGDTLTFVNCTGDCLTFKKLGKHNAKLNSWNGMQLCAKTIENIVCTVKQNRNRVGNTECFMNIKIDKLIITAKWTDNLTFIVMEII